MHFQPDAPLSPSAIIPALHTEEDEDEVTNDEKPTGLVALPSEVIEHVYHMLSMTDQLGLLRTCRTLKNIYDSSSTLQYHFSLQTTAYLDVRYEPPPYKRLLEPSSSHSPTGFGGSGSGSSSSTFPFLGRKLRPDYDVPSVGYSPPKLHRSDIDEEEMEHSAATTAPWHAAPRNPDFPFSASEKLQSLQRREANWETLNFASERSFTIKGPAGVYELQEGIFLMCDEYSGTDDGKPSSIRLIPLPTHEDPWLEYPPLSLRSQRLPFAIADLTMDPTQDLIVVSENHPAAPNSTERQHPTHRYHLLRMSTFEPHPLAAFPTLDFPPFSHLVTQTRQLLQVMGDVLVVLVSRYVAHWLLAGMAMGIGGLANAGVEEEIVVWNWKTGQVLSRLGLPENGWFASLALLTPSTFMITSTSSISPVMPSDGRNTASIFPPVVQIYTFGSEPNQINVPGQPLLVDYMDDSTPRPILVAQLELPKFAPGATVSSFDVRPDPAFPPRVPSASSTKGGDPAPRLGGSKPFTQDPAKGVLVFDLHIWEPLDDGDGQERREMISYELFVLRETLIEVADLGEQRLAQARENSGPEGYRRSEVEVTVPWDEWGRTGARLMDISMDRRSWVCSCSGYRFASIIPSDEDPTRPEDHHELVPHSPVVSDLRVLDFSPYNVLKERSKLERKRPRGRAPRQSRSPMPFSSAVPGPSSSSGRRSASAHTSRRETDPERPWESIQDIATSSAPVKLTLDDIQALLSRMHRGRGRAGYGSGGGMGREDAYMPAAVDLEELTILKFREQYDRLFWAAAASRTKSDRADRERGRGRAGGNRASSRSQSRSRSRSTSVTPLAGGSGAGRGREGSEHRSRSSARSTSPVSIFRATMNPINMSGSAYPAGMALDDDETEYEVRLVLAPTVLEKRKIWREDVVSGLPFREVWRRLERKANGVMIDDQRIIVVRTEGRKHGDWSAIWQEMTVLCM